MISTYFFFTFYWAETRKSIRFDDAQKTLKNTGERDTVIDAQRLYITNVSHTQIHTTIISPAKQLICDRNGYYLERTKRSEYRNNRIQIGKIFCSLIISSSVSSVGIENGFCHLNWAGTGGSNAYMHRARARARLKDR